MKTVPKSTAPGSLKENEISSFAQRRHWEISFELQMSTEELFTTLRTAFSLQHDVVAKMRNIRVSSTSI